jgi:hypothetical protein
MTKRFLFADEAGCFVFKNNGRASKYYIVCTVSMDSIEVGKELLDLRKRLAWDKRPVGDFFHCSPDKQEIRDEVFAVLQRHDFRIFATIMEKSKAQPQIRSTDHRFYQHGWFYHLQNSSERLLEGADQLHVVAATLGTKKKRITFEDAVRDVCKQTLAKSDFRTSFWPSMADPCLQVADYCTWAIQRKWETGCTLSYDLISDRIDREYDLWQRGKTHYYK